MLLGHQQKGSRRGVKHHREARAEAEVSHLARRALATGNRFGAKKTALSMRTGLLPKKSDYNYKFVLAMEIRHFEYQHGGKTQREDRNGASFNTDKVVLQ
jgi:hypothetical protein